MSAAIRTDAGVGRSPQAQVDVRSPKALFELAKGSVTAWIEDFAPSMGAAISYYTIFSIAPLLLIVIAIAGVVFGSDAAAGRIYSELGGLLGQEGAKTIQSMVESASKPERSILGTIIGIVTLMIGATTVFAELQSALDRIWRAPAAAKSEGIFALIRARLLSFGMILTIGFLLLVSLLVSAVLSAAGSLWEPDSKVWEVVLQVLNFIVNLVVITALFAAIYKWLPRVKIAWHDVWIGAVVTAVLFTVGKLLIGLYIGKSGIVSGFGAAASLVVLLLWVYYSAQIFLLGAEFTWLYAYRFGSRRGEKTLPSEAPARESSVSQTTLKATPKAANDSAQKPPRDGPFGALRLWLAIGKLAYSIGRQLGRLARRRLSKDATDRDAIGANPLAERSVLRSAARGMRNRLTMRFGPGAR